MTESSRYERHVYHILIVIMLGSAPLEAIVGGESALIRTFWALLPIAVAFSLLRQRALFATAVLLGLAAFGIEFSIESRAGAYAGAVAFAFTAVILLRRVFEHAVVTGATISASLCAYLLIGVTFARLFRGIVLDDPAAFVAGSGDPVTVSDLGYFSIVTLTTLGFGDIAPRSHAARSFVVVEALLGQLYLVAVVARVVGLSISPGREVRG